MNRKPNRYFVFVRSSYIRDAQMFCGETVGEERDDYCPENDDDNYCDVGGDMLVMDICEADIRAVIERIEEMYPDTALDIFTVYEVNGVTEHHALSAIKAAKSKETKTSTQEVAEE